MPGQDRQIKAVLYNCSIKLEYVLDGELPSQIIPHPMGGLDVRGFQLINVSTIVSVSHSVVISMPTNLCGRKGHSVNIYLNKLNLRTQTQEQLKIGIAQ